jgi:transcriptional regulator with XRE-family HTH domain
MINHTRPLSQDPVLLRILALLKQQNKSQKNLTDYLGLHPNTFNNWKYQNTQSYLKYLDKIADYLDVSPGYLIRGNTVGADTEDYTPLESKLINEIRVLSSEQQQALLTLIKEFK